jgi:flagellar secretion chaperone FliS
MSYPTYGPSVYKEISINTASPAKLVVMLYEGAIRFLRQTESDVRNKDFAKKSQSVDRAVAIIQHLQGTLDLEKGGQVAFDLDRLYTYITSRIFDGSAKLDLKAFEEAIQLLTTLLSGWEEIARREQERSVPADLLAKQAAGGRLELHA